MLKPLPFCILALLIFLSACHKQPPPQPPRVKETVSGHPEIVLNMSVDEAIAHFTERCLNRQLVIKEISQHHVLCGRVISSDEVRKHALFIGNSYSTVPEVKARFSIVKLPEKKLKIQVYQWLETQMAYGQVRKYEMNSNAQFNSIQNFLDSLQNR